MARLPSRVVGQEPGELLGTQTPRRFLDFVVDGVSLYDRSDLDFIAPLGWLSVEEDEASAERLLGTAPPDLDGRVALYICPEDADLYCGAVTATIERESNEVIWRHMAFSSFDYDEDRWVHDTEGFGDFQELRFPAAEYSEAIANRPKPAQ